MPEILTTLVDEDLEEAYVHGPACSPSSHNEIISLKEDYCKGDFFGTGGCSCLCRRGLVWSTLFPVEESLLSRDPFPARPW